MAKGKWNASIAAIFVLFLLPACKTDDGKALHQAIQKGDLSQVESLIKKGANIEARGEHDFTPLHTAAHGRNIEIVRYLVSKGADVNAVKKAGNAGTPIGWAILNDDLVMAKFLKEHGAKVSQKFWPSELWKAIRTGNPEMVEWVLEQEGINPNLPDEVDGDTALHQAVREQEGPNLQIVQILLKHKADPQIKNAKGKTVIDLVKEKQASLQEIEKALVGR